MLWWEDAVDKVFAFGSDEVANALDFAKDGRHDGWCWLFMESAYQALQKEIRTGLSRMGEFECLRLCADDILENCSSGRYSKMWVRVVTRRKHAGEAQAGLKEI